MYGQKIKQKNNITKIIDSILSKVLMVLLNEIFLEAFWKIEFVQKKC